MYYIQRKNIGKINTKNYNDNIWVVAYGQLLVSSLRFCFISPPNWSYAVILHYSCKY